MTAHPLSLETLLGLVQYDPETGFITWVSNTGRKKFIGRECGYIDPSNGYRKIQIRGRNYYAHRIAWLFSTGEWPENEVDHINGDRTDNRRCNLREATTQQNTCNRDATLGASGAKCVHQLPSGRYVSAITLNRERTHLGTFDTVAEASAAYARAATLFHGEFARL